MAKEKKTDEERIEAIYKLAKDHFGDIRFVGIKYQSKIGWLAKIKFNEFESLIDSGETSTDALRNLKKRVKKIIKRYNTV